MIIRELITRLGFSVNDSQLTKYQRGTEGIKRSAEGAADAFRNMFLAFAGFSAIQSLARTADEVQNLEARIAGMPQTIGATGDAFNEISARASAARQPLKEYATLYTRIGFAAKDYLSTQAEVLDITDAVSKGLIIGGASAQESASVMGQLSQALGSGTLQGEEFRAMAEGAPQMLDALAKAMGFPRDQLKELASQGKITTKALVLAFKEIGPEISRQFVTMPITIGQSLAIVNNRFQTFVARLNRESGAVTTIANAFIGGFNMIESGLNKMVDFFGGSTQTLKFFALMITAAVIPALIKLGIGFVALLASPAGILIAALVLLGLVLEDVYQYFTGGESVLGKMDGWVRVLTLGMLALTVAVGIFGAGAVASFGSAAIAILAASWPILLLIAALAGAMYALYLLWDNWKTIWAGMKDIAAKVWQGLVSGFTSAIDKIKGYWNGFKSFFGMGVSTTVTATQAAGAASSPSGVPAAGSGSNVTINQTLPPGSPEETKVAARKGTTQALMANPWEKSARQMGQVQ